MIGIASETILLEPYFLRKTYIEIHLNKDGLFGNNTVGWNTNTIVIPIIVSHGN